MARSEQLVWPRTPEGWCSCPYCTACRAGTLPPVDAPPKRGWLERMGGRDRSVAASLSTEEEPDG